jgi:hypothetical protein
MAWISSTLTVRPTAGSRRSLARASPRLRRSCAAHIRPRTYPPGLYRHATRHIVTTGENLRMQLVRAIACRTHYFGPDGIDAYASPGERGAARLPVFLPGRVSSASWRHEKLEGPRYLLEAVHGLPGDVGLVVVSDGPQRRYRAKICELGMSSRTWLAGNQENVLPWLQSLDVFASVLRERRHPAGPGSGDAVRYALRHNCRQHRGNRTGWRNGDRRRGRGRG